MFMIGMSARKRRMTVSRIGTHRVTLMSTVAKVFGDSMKMLPRRRYTLPTLFVLSSEVRTATLDPMES